LTTDGLETSEATGCGFYNTRGKLAVNVNFWVRVIPRYYCANFILMAHLTAFLRVQKFGDGGTLLFPEPQKFRGGPKVPMVVAPKHRPIQ
jgi:hypothetical protein